MRALHHLGRAWSDTFAGVLRDGGVLLILLVAPVIYSLLYPWPYSNQAVRGVPVAVVDQDHTGLTRQIVRYAQASPRLDLRLVTGDLQEAEQALWRGEIEGYALLPADLKRHVLRGEVVTVPIEGNGAYALLNKTVLAGFSEVLGTVSAGIEVRKLNAAGETADQAAASRSPVNTQLLALFNPTEGYGNYVVPAVALLILQQTLLMGAAMLAGTWAETGRLRAGPWAWLGRVLALSTLGIAMGAFYFGWMFAAQDFPRGGNPAGALVLLSCYVPAVAVTGLLLGLWFRDRERALQALLFTALPLAFVSGFAWPVEALPEALQWLRWLAPSSAGIQASLRLNQMGASLTDVLPQLTALIAIGLGGFAALLWFGRNKPAAQPIATAWDPQEVKRDGRARRVKTVQQQPRGPCSHWAPRQTPQTRPNPRSAA